VRHLHFTQSLEPLQGGGLGTSTVALHRQMLALGLDSQLCATFTGAPQRPVERTFEFKRVGPGFLYVAPQLIGRADELVKQHDIVHGHGLYVGPNQAFGQAARRQGKPLVYHVHGMFEPYILGRSRWKKQLAHWLFENANFRHACLWRALTHKEATQIRACGIQAPIVVAANGLNLEDFAKPKESTRAPREVSIPQPKKDKFRLLFLGRIHPKKGLDLLLAAWDRLRRFHKQWELIVAGPDEDGYLATLQKMAGDLGVGSEVRFTGAVTGQTKVALLRSADLFVLPSYSEGFSMSLLEAMACSIPVIATIACNFPEISQRQAGWECDPCLSSVTQVLETGMHVDSLERCQRGRNGRCLVEENYTWPPIIKRLLEACQTHCR
jgi:glycosyltransferase involved in cell wall biosynthesis